MGHTTGIVFDLTFKPDTPQTVLDLFVFLAGCPDFKHHSNAERNFCSLLMKCPDELTNVMFDPRYQLDRKLFLLVTCCHDNINGWRWREFNKKTRRFRSAADCKYDADDETNGGIVDILDALTPYLVLKETGTICARSKHEHDFQETVYWFDHAGFCKSPGYRYKSNDPNYSNYKDRDLGWVFYGEFQPPMDYKELVKQGLHKRKLEETPSHQEKPMQENTTEIKKPFKVLANLDQLQKHGLDKKHDWQPEHADKMPNRVMTCLETKEQAIELYNTLWRQKLVCFRNWID